jgi:hypothetical protein
MSIPGAKRKPAPLLGAQTWLQIYAHVLEAISSTVNDPKVAHTIAASAANAILKEVSLGD